jgi:hypothetical protein
MTASRCYVASVRDVERAAAILELIHEIERERDETSDTRKQAVLDAEAMQLRAMYTRLIAQANGGTPPSS